MTPLRCSHTLGRREGGQSSSVLSTQQPQQRPSGPATADLPFQPTPNPELPNNVISWESWVRNGPFTDNQLGQEHNDQMREASARDIPSLEKPGSRAQGQRGERPQGRTVHGIQQSQNITNQSNLNNKKHPHRRQLKDFQADFPTLTWNLCSPDLNSLHREADGMTMYQIKPFWC